MPAADFPQGRRFRVRIPAGARPPSLNGYKPMHGISGAQQSVRIVLEEGDVITCDGQRWGWGSDPGLEIFFLDPRDPAVAAAERASYLSFFPTTGHWMAAEPDMRYLEPLD